jgi:hypothetical protein
MDEQLVDTVAARAASEVLWRVLVIAGALLVPPFTFLLLLFARAGNERARRFRCNWLIASGCLTLLWALYIVLGIGVGVGVGSSGGGVGVGSSGIGDGPATAHLTFTSSR